MMTLDQYRTEALKALHRADCAADLGEKRSWEACATSWKTLADTAEWQDAFASTLMRRPASKPPLGFDG